MQVTAPYEGTAISVGNMARTARSRGTILSLNQAARTVLSAVQTTLPAMNMAYNPGILREDVGLLRQAIEELRSGRRRWMAGLATPGHARESFAKA